jgi:hypothetical protein
MKIVIHNETFDFDVTLTNKKKHFPYDIPDCQWITRIERDCAYIYLKDYTHRVLVHECIHVAQWILDKKWIKTGIKNTEVLAYVTDWIYNEFLKKIEK